MILIGIVGWKNSGKTYYVKQIVEKITSLGLKVSTIKHAHHDFDTDLPNTDSYIHRKAGAQEVIVSSSKRWVKIKELNTLPEKKLNELIETLEDPDIVIIEGFKKEEHPKIEIIKKSTTKSDFMFNNLKNVVAIISDIEISTFGGKQFKGGQIKEIVEFILKKKHE